MFTKTIFTLQDPEKTYLDDIAYIEWNYADKYIWRVGNAALRDSGDFIIPIDHLKQAFYLAFARFKKTPAKESYVCDGILKYGIRHYPDSGFQEMKHNFEEWIKEKDSNV